MTQNILDVNYDNLTLHQDEFEIKDEQDSSIKIYRVRNYVQTKCHRNFSKSCRIITGCAALCVITIITIVIINDAQNSATIWKTRDPTKLSKDNLRNISSNNTIHETKQISSVEPVLNKNELENNATYNQSANQNDDKAQSHYFLQEILLSDNNKFFLFDIENKSLSLFYEAETTIDTFDIFTKERLFFSSFREESSTIYSFSAYKNTPSINAIFNENRFKSRGIAFDYIDKNLYAIDEHMGTLIVLNLDTKLSALLLTDLIQPRNIYVDSVERILFILQVSHSIIKGNMTGEYLHNVVEGTGITAMTLDCINKRIYWVNDIIGIESSDYNGKQIKQFSTHTASIIDLAIMDDKLFWLWQNHHNPSKHHLLFCQINGKYCDNHEMHHLENLHNLTTIRSIYGLKSQNVSKLASYPCEVENGGCEQLCLSVSNERHVCVCAFGWQLNPDKITCLKVSNYLLFMDENVIRGHVLDTAGSFLTDIILPTPYQVENVGNAVVFDYDQLNDNFYFSDGTNLYQTKLTKYKYHQQKKLLYRNEIDFRIIDIVYDWERKKVYICECRTNSYRNFENYCVIRRFHVDEDEVVVEQTYNMQQPSNIRSGITVYFRKQWIYYINMQDTEIRKFHYPSSAEESIHKTTTEISLIPRPITIDYKEKKIYWIDQFYLIDDKYRIVIQCSTLDGQNIMKINVDNINIQPKYIFVYYEWIYLASDKTIWRIYKKSGKGAMKLVSSSRLFIDIKLISNTI